MTNTSELKQREHRSWTGVAPGWRKHDERLVASSAPVTARMIDLLQLRPGTNVLDIACGTGPDGRVTLPGVTWVAGACK